MKAKTKIFSCVLVILLSMILVSPFCNAMVAQEERTLDEIKAKYRERPFPFRAFKDVEYDIEPSAVFPYSAGKVKEDFLKEALDCVNFIRYLEGFPDDIILNETYIDYAQHGAVLLAAIDQLTHSPSQPADMPDDFYAIAYTGPSSSNCGWGYTNILHSIQSYMNDSDSSNINRVGHRRWLLNPAMQRIGFGYYNYYTDTYVFDSSRQNPIQVDYVSWPTKNYMPFEFMERDLAWSVNLGDAYDYPVPDSVSVLLTRRSDGKSWIFNRHSDFTGTMNYFNIENSPYGMSKCIIFRPDIDKYDKNDVFDVYIAGITRNGVFEDISYSVQLFPLLEPTPVKATLEEGTYINEAEIAFFCDSPDAVIFYTTDGSTPNQYSNYYYEPIKVNETTTFSAISYVNGETSQVSTFHYRIEKASEWAADGVKQAIVEKLVPASMQINYQQNITRADFCKLAVNFLIQKTGKPITEILSEKNVQTQQGAFTDTSDFDILAANALGIVNGIGNGKFNPDGLISRQEAAVMLMRTAKVLGVDNLQGTPASFSDSDDFAEWARDGIAFVSTLADKKSSQRVMSGVGNNMFSPFGTYTREQSYITMLRMFYALD